MYRLRTFKCHLLIAILRHLLEAFLPCEHSMMCFGCVRDGTWLYYSASGIKAHKWRLRPQGVSKNCPDCLACSFPKGDSVFLVILLFFLCLTVVHETEARPARSLTPNSWKALIP